MTGALMSAALAVLLWPAPDAVRRKRLAAVVDPGPTSRRWPGVEPAVAAAVLAGSVGAVWSTPLVAALACVAAFALARTWQAGRLQQRSEDEVHALTDGLAIVAAELRAGRSVTAASEVAGAAGTDAGRALVTAVCAPGEIGVGHPDPGARSALEQVAAGAELSARTGCSLVSVLSAVEDDLRARARHRVELRAATSGPRAGAAVLAGLPVLGLAMGSGVGAEPWRVLTTTPAGQVLLAAGVALELAGLAWSRRLIERALR